MILAGRVDMMFQGKKTDDSPDVNTSINKKANENIDNKKSNKKEKVIDDKEVKKALSTVIVTTGDIKRNYTIKECVFSIGADEGSLGFIKPSPDAAFKQAELQLKIKAYKLGCNAVICAQFEHRITVSKSAMGALTGISALGQNQGIEVFAYGTAVKISM